MTFHVICQVGADDQYLPTLDDGDCEYRIALGRSNDRQAIANTIDAGCRASGLSVPPRATDLLRLALSAYCADVGIQRSRAYDSWTRDLHLHIPFAEPEVWSDSIPIIVEFLSFLTGDHWQVSVRPLAADQRDNGLSRDDGERISPDVVALFSGGLDSFVGAIDLLSKGQDVALVSHHGAGTINKAQHQVHAELVAEYADKAKHLSFYVQPPAPLEGQLPEKSTRSRSVLFFALGTTVATGCSGKPPLVVPENGLISLNPPLTDSRTGSLSTRTTHPHTVELFRRLLEKVGINVRIDLPYRFVTKGEMVQKARNQPAFESGVGKTISCSHPDVGRFAGRSPGENCGYCLPCIIRRAALFGAGLDDPAKYQLDILTSPPSPSSDTGSDLRALEIALERFATKPRSRLLFDVLDTGPVPPDDIRDYLDVYVRGMEEIRAFCRS